MTATTAASVEIEQSSAVPAAAAGPAPGSWDYCKPPAPVPGETEAETLARYQRSFDGLSECFNAELKVRPETSLLGFLIIKVLIPFTAISAGISAFYARFVTRAESRYDNAEYGLAGIYFVVALLLLLAWYFFRKRDVGSKERKGEHLVKNFLNYDVPPSKERLTRNRYVNRWVYYCLTFGVILLIPFLFLVFRTNALESVGMRLIIDTAGICEPTPGGYNPFEGSDTCANAGYVYKVAPVETGAIGALGTEQFPSALDVAESAGDPDALHAGEVRLDVTTTLGFFFVILLGGIGVNMIRWWLKNRKAKRAAVAATA